MANIIANPSRYIQGQGALAELCLHAKSLGDKLFILVSASGRKRVETIIQQSAEKYGCAICYEIFNGECSKKEIDRIGAAYQASNCNLMIGIGGGKIHDTAKAAAYYQKVPVIIIPTIASTDAPCSALSVIYKDNGVFEEYLFLPSSPNIVLVDTDIISAAPARLLVAGMGDALATYFEARACVRSSATNCVGGTATLAAIKLAQLCYETLLVDGNDARIAVENNVCTKSVENIIEANTYLSGIGFESGGLAASHAIHNAMTVMAETHDMYHGEKVAYGTLVQLILENDTENLKKCMDFCVKVGLPVTLEALGVKQIDPAKLRQVAELACAPTDTMGNMPFTVTPDAVYAAIVTVNAMGKERS